MSIQNLNLQCWLRIHRSLLAVLLAFSLAPGVARASDKPHPEYVIDDKGLRLTIDPQDYCDSREAVVEFRQPGGVWQTADSPSFYALSQPELVDRCVVGAGTARERRLAPGLDVCIVCQGESRRQRVDAGFSYACLEDPMEPPGSGVYIPDHPQMECNDEPPGGRITGLFVPEIRTASSSDTGYFPSFSGELQRLGKGGFGVRFGLEYSGSADPIQGSDIEHELWGADLGFVWSVGGADRPGIELALGLGYLDWRAKGGGAADQERFRNAVLEDSWMAQLSVSPKLAKPKGWVVQPSVTLRWVEATSQFQTLFGVGVGGRTRARGSLEDWMTLANEIQDQATQVFESTETFVQDVQPFTAVSSQSYLIRSCGREAIDLLQDMQDQCGLQCTGPAGHVEGALGSLSQALGDLRGYLGKRCHDPQAGCGTIAYCCQRGQFPNYEGCTKFEDLATPLDCTDLLVECPRGTTDQIPGAPASITCH